MPRMRPLKREEAPAEARAAFDRNIEAYGQVLAGTGLYAYRPSIMAGRQALVRGVEDSGLIAPRLYNLIRMRVALVVGCPF